MSDIRIISVGQEWEITKIDYRPGDGLVIRTDEDMSLSAVRGLNQALREVLADSPCKVYRVCCDSAPVGDEAHADDCPNAKKGKAKR